MSVKNYSFLSCSFCGKGNKEVEFLVAGPTVFICDECTELAWEIVQEKKAKANKLAGNTDVKHVKCYDAV